MLPIVLGCSQLFFKYSLLVGFTRKYWECYTLPPAVSKKGVNQKLAHFLLSHSPAVHLTIYCSRKMQGEGGKTTIFPRKTGTTNWNYCYLFCENFFLQFLAKHVEKELLHFFIRCLAKHEGKGNGSLVRRKGAGPSLKGTKKFFLMRFIMMTSTSFVSFVGSLKTLSGIKVIEGSTLFGARPLSSQGQLELALAALAAGKTPYCQTTGIPVKSWRSLAIFCAASEESFSTSCAAQTAHKKQGHMLNALDTSKVLDKVVLNFKYHSGKCSIAGMARETLALASAQPSVAPLQVHEIFSHYLPVLAGTVKAMKSERLHWAHNLTWSQMAIDFLTIEEEHKAKAIAAVVPAPLPVVEPVPLPPPKKVVKRRKAAKTE